MDFAQQIKNLRKQEGLTQEEFAQKLLVSRQAVSNWENNRNLPDIALIIKMAEEFDISLNQLLLGEEAETNPLTQKLIHDGNETRRAKLNMITSLIGALLMGLGFLLLVIKTLSVEYIDEQGILHENFFLLFFGFLFLLSGFLTISISSAAFALKKWREKRSTSNLVNH